MKLYKIWQSTNEDYDTYDSAIVCAMSEDEAKAIHPNGYGLILPNSDSSWVSFENVKCKYLGEADSAYDKPIVICASFNAG